MSRKNIDKLFDPIFLSPYLIINVYIFVVLLYSLSNSDLFYKYYFIDYKWNLHYAIFSVLLVISLVISIRIGQRLPIFSIKFTYQLMRAENILFITLLVGIIYCTIFFASIGTSMNLIFSKDVPMYTIKKMIAKEPIGSLFFQQISLISFSLYPIIKGTLDRKKLFYTKIMLAIFSVMIILKSLLWSNRLLIFEAFISYITVKIIMENDVKKKLNFRRVVRIITNIFKIGLGVFIIFGIFEATRSWRNVPLDERNVSNLLLFIYYRFLGYYLTSQNNAAAIFRTFNFDHTPTFFSFNWFWTVSVFTNTFPSYDYFFRTYVPISREENFTFPLLFDLYPSFNVFGFNGYLYLDYGWYSLIFAGFCGIVVGYTWKNFLRKKTFALLLYPYILIGLLELPRIYYFGESRFFYTISSIILIRLIIGRNINKGEKYEKY